MSAKSPAKLREEASTWWSTSIIDIQPGTIRVRGYPIEDLIGALSFPEMIWLILRGEAPASAQAKLFEAALVAAVDHGPQAPSIAIARMAVTCGLSVNGAMASAINALDDIHGGAGQGAAATDRGTHAAIARAFGAEGIASKAAEKFKPALERAIKSNKPTVIDVAMLNEPVPTAGHWNINDIYSPGRETSHVATTTA